MSQTKNEDTKKLYIERSGQLMIRAYKEMLSSGKNVDDNSIIINYKGEDKVAMSILYTSAWASKVWINIWMQSTWKLNRSALIYYAELEFEKGNLSSEKLKKVKQLLRKSHSTISEKSGKTSNQKKKSFNLKEMKMIDDELKKSRSRWANPTRIFIRSGKYTGLRPSEWRSAEINVENKYLVVKNGKSTNGRSFGEYRTLSLHHLSDEQIKDVSLHISVVKKIEENDMWKIYYEGCSGLLRRLSRKIWPNKDKYPTLYSCRHQFSADMKASGCTKKEVAALMGHASDRTAQEHYGKKIHGTRGKKPKVSKVDMALVRVSNKRKFSFENNKK